MQNRHADLNVIDYEGLTSCHPEYVNDFPHNGGRIVVRSQGYDTTIVGGQVVIEKGEFSGISKWPATLSLRTQRRPPSGYSSLVSLVSIGDEPSALHRYLLKRVGGIRRRSNRTWPEYRRVWPKSDQKMVDAEDQSSATPPGMWGSDLPWGSSSRSRHGGWHWRVQLSL